MAKKTNELKTILISEIRENEAALRTVNKQAENYLGIVSSIRVAGLLKPLLVRRNKDEESGQSYYELCDGLQRFSACKDAGVTEIPVYVKDLDDDKMLEAQIMANFHKVETKPAQYAQSLKRILVRNSLMTITEMAGRLGVSSDWINKRLSLNKISNPTILQSIDAGDIPLAQAVALSKLPDDEQVNYVDRAMTLPAKEFAKLVGDRSKEIRDANRAGGDAAAETFTPVEHMQKMKDVQAALTSGEVIQALVIDAGIKDPIDAATVIIKWFLHVDPVSVEVQRAKWQERKNVKAAKAETKKKAAAEKKAAADAAREAKAADIQDTAAAIA